MKQTTPAILAALLSAAMFALAGCGGGSGGVVTSEIARIAQAEMDAVEAQTEVEALQPEVDALQAEINALQAAVEAFQAQVEALDIPVDGTKPPATPNLDAFIAAVQEQVATLVEEIASPTPPRETLGADRSGLSASDLAALARTIIGELSTPYDHDGDGSLVNLPDISAPGSPSNAATRDVTLASNTPAPDGALKIIAGGDGFLKHTFRRTGTAVDLTSPNDIATLRLGALLEVDGVDLMSFSLRETDKVLAPVRSNSNGMSDFSGAYITTTTLRADGTATWHVVPIVGGRGRNIVSTYVDGAWVEEYGGTDINGGPLNAGDAAAEVAFANGRTTEYRVANDLVSYRRFTPFALADALPITRLALNRSAYRSNRTRIAQHTARGYGAWLDDSFFAAYTLRASVFGRRDETAYKIAWGGRTADSAMAANLSGLGDTATWKGLMLGHDLDDDASSYGDRLQGNATLTARIMPNTLGSTRMMDVSFTNIINAAGEPSRVSELHWEDLALRNAPWGDAEVIAFSKGREITGRFYDNGNEVVGQFSRSDILGVFGAVEAEMMEDTVMAGQ